MQIENRFLYPPLSWLFNYDLFKGSNSCIISLPQYIHIFYGEGMLWAEAGKILVISYT